MTFLDVVVLAIVWGLTQVLPLSALGHLSFVTSFLPSPETTRALLVAADGGVVAALTLYLWRDLWAMATGLVKLIKGRRDPGAHLLGLVLAGSLPAGAAAFAFTSLGGGGGGVLTAASAMLTFGALLWGADRLGVTLRRVEHMGFGSAALIGMLQAAALIPGVSRTGVTITAARLLGYERRAAARFSLLLALPLFAGHGLYTLWQASQLGELTFAPSFALISVASGGAAWLAAVFMMSWLGRHSFTPFAIWRVLLGGGVLILTLLSHTLPA